MFKYLKKFMLVSLMLCLLVGCSKADTTKAYTFKVGTGDKVKVTLDTSDEYKLNKKESRFTILKNKKTISEGTFINQSSYDRYVSTILENSKIKVIDTKKEDKYSYYFYKLNGDSGKEYDYMIWLKGSNTGIMLTNSKSKKTAMEVFEKLTFENVH